MALSQIPMDIQARYEIYDWRHATAILTGDFPEPWADILDVLRAFYLSRSTIMAAGGNKSPIAGWIDAQFSAKGWMEKQFDTRIIVDGYALDTPTHKVDCVKGPIALEIEWNNKDPFFDRDLNNFRLLFELRAISVGVIITRCSELQDIFNTLGKGSSYGQSTTHMAKLLPRIGGGGGGGCPLLVFGISPACYVDDLAR